MATDSRPSGGAPARHQRDEETERRVGDDVGDHVEARPARRPRSEQEERRARRGGDPRREGLQARVDDREPVERDQEMRKQRRMRARAEVALRHRRVSAAGRAACASPSGSCARPARRTPPRETATTGRDNGRWRCVLSRPLERKRIDDVDPARRERCERAAEQRARDAAAPPRRRDDEADDGGGWMRRSIGSAVRGDPHARACSAAAWIAAAR